MWMLLCRRCRDGAEEMVLRVLVWAILVSIPLNFMSVFKLLFGATKNQSACSLNIDDDNIGKIECQEHELLM